MFFLIKVAKNMALFVSIKLQAHSTLLSTAILEATKLTTAALENLSQYTTNTATTISKTGFSKQYFSLKNTVDLYSRLNKFLSSIDSIGCGVLDEELQTFCMQHCAGTSIETLLNATGFNLNELSPQQNTQIHQLITNFNPMPQFQASAAKHPQKAGTELKNPIKQAKTTQKI